MRSDPDQSDIVRQEYEESIALRTKQKSKKESDKSIPIWIKVSEKKFDFIKQIINKNKNLGTKIDGKRYTLINAYNLVNKITNKKIE